ncbi:MAG TPA: hypothetical protein VG839_03675 [Asticcacaulis sp.]|nr:hypothetical protein [Asticcacaulis sp.]
MTSAPRRLAPAVCALAAPLALAAAVPANATPGAYLSWQNKAQQTAPVPTVTSSGETYPVPPSPYGQVGDPFVRPLNWPGKGVTARPAPQPQALANIEVPPPPAADMPSGPVSLSSPVPLAKPAPVRVPDQAVAPAAPKPAPQAMRPVPDAPKTKAVPKAKAQPAPAAQPQPTPPQQATNDGGYQVPATSKYAARIAAARNAQMADQAQPQQQAAAPAKPAAKANSAGHTATAPAPAEPLAAQETDHVFIPGEQYTNAQDGPRLYSLHRAYGLTPDPITVDHDATGAILDTADLNADEGKDDGKGDAKDTDKDTGQSDQAGDSKTKP